MAKFPKGLKKAVPYIVALLSFMIFSMIYFAPQYSGDVIKQGDMIQSAGMGRDIAQHVAQYGEHPQWEGAMFCGMPAYLINMNYDGRLVKYTADALYFIGQPAAYIFVAMSVFFLMLLCFGVNPWLAMVGGFAYGLSTYFYIIIAVGHITQMIALAFAPGLIGAIYYAYRKNMFIGAVLAGIFAAIEIGANHFQITYYFLIIMLALFINELVVAVKEKTLPKFVKTSLMLLLAGGLAIGANFNQIYYVATHSHDTMRGGSEIAGLSSVKSSQTTSKGLDLAYATQWSYGKAETFNLFIPNLMGGSSDKGFSPNGQVADALRPYADAIRPYSPKQFASSLPAYWGPQPFTSGPVYIGAVLIFLFVLGMFLLEGAKKWWLLIVSALAIFLSWGHNLMWLTEFFYYNIPFYNKFRTVSMILVIVEFCVPLGAILCVQRLLAGDIDREQFKKAMNWSVGICASVALIFLLVGSNLFNFSNPVDKQLPMDVVSAMRNERIAMMHQDSIRSLVYVLLTAGIVWLLVGKKIKLRVAIVALGVLVLADVTTINLRYMNHDNFTTPRSIAPQPTEADRQIMADTEPGFRVVNLTSNTFNDALTSNFHRSVGGYHPAKLSRYQDLIERYLSTGDVRIYNMLNSKYFITLGANKQPEATLNPQNLGAAWFVDEIAPAENAISELERLNEVNLRTTAVVNPEFSKLVEKDSAVDTSRYIKMTEYRVNKHTYSYKNDHRAVAVFSEIYYPKGWTAYIDGQEAPHFRANYVLRAMSLPAGEHTVEFRFSAPNFGKVTGLTYACSSILLLGLVGSLVYVYLRRRKTQEEE